MIPRPPLPSPDTEAMTMLLTPSTELETRIARVQERLRRDHFDGALIIGNSHLFYLTGTIQQGSPAPAGRGRTAAARAARPRACPGGVGAAQHRAAAGVPRVARGPRAPGPAQRRAAGSRARPAAGQPRTGGSPPCCPRSSSTTVRRCCGRCVRSSRPSRSTGSARPPCRPTSRSGPEPPSSAKECPRTWWPPRSSARCSATGTRVCCAFVPSTRRCSSPTASPVPTRGWPRTWTCPWPAGD